MVLRARTTRWLLLACLLSWPVLAGAAADPIVFTSPPTDLANVAGIVPLGVKQRVAGSKKRRYPDLRTKLRAFGLKVKSAWKGHEVINGACFLDYLAPGLQASWQALLVSTPQTCGSHVWDRKGTLQGAWFHPELGKTDFFELERGALAIGPDNLAPAMSLQISIGSGSSYAALDPSGALPHLDRAFRVDFDSSPGARVNPDPAQVTAATGTVCYDLAYDEGAGPRYNLLRLHLVSSKRLAIDFDATPALAAACAAAPLGEPDASWTATYVR